MRAFINGILFLVIVLAMTFNVAPAQNDFGKDYIEPNDTLAEGVSVDYLGSALWNTPYRMAFDGAFAYVRYGPGILVLNMLNPLEPTLVSRYFYPGFGWVTDMVVYQNYLYVTTEANLLHILDISNPYSISFVRTLYPGILGKGLFISTDDFLPGNNLYVAAFFGGLCVFNLDDPSNPNLVYNITLSGATSVAYSRVWAFTTNSNRMFVYDTRDFSYCDPATCYETAFYFPEQVWDIAISGDYAYLASFSGGLYIVDISSPATPVMIDTLDCGRAEYCYTYGSYLYVAANLDGLYIFDISDPTNATQVLHLDYAGSIRDIEFSGDYAFFTAGAQDFKILDISDPPNAFWAGHFYDNLDMSGNAREVELVGDYAIVGTDRIACGMMVLDISDPTDPFIAATDGYGASMRFVIKDNLVFKVQDNFGLAATDISDILNPIRLPNLPVGESDKDLAIKGDMAYVAANTLGYKVFDISDPNNISEVWNYSDGFGTYYRAWSVAIKGDYVYWGNTIGTWIYDISEPKDPVLVDSIITNCWTMDIVFKDNLGLIAERANGLRAVDVSDPAHPVTIGIYEDELYTDFYELAISGNYCYIADDWYGDFRVLDISDPADIQMMARVDLGASMVRGVAVRQPNIYVASKSGLFIFAVHLPCDIPGDANGDDACDIGDAVYLISYIFTGGPEPDNMDEGDANSDCTINVGDAVFLIGYIFSGGPSPSCGCVE